MLEREPEDGCIWIVATRFDSKPPKFKGLKVEKITAKQVRTERNNGWYQHVFRIDSDNTIEGASWTRAEAYKRYETECIAQLAAMQRKVKEAETRLAQAHRLAEELAC